MDRPTFVQHWGSNLERGSASVFIGAGLSQSAGYPGWRDLLKDIAKELGLDIDSEHDLAAVAQYSINRAVGKRHRLAELIAREFPPRPVAPEVFRALARLPLTHVWTTNYDSLPETAWRNERKLLDVKSRNEDLGVDKPWAHAILYKMHGSVDHPNDVVIAKDDYEMYRQMRPGFLQVLNGHFVGKQMLFLGFSFTDPNISHLFGTLREIFGPGGPQHYAIVRRPQTTIGGKKGGRYKTEVIRHQLWIEDLQRYGIQTVEIDEFSEIGDILHDVERWLGRRSVFVSGSFPSEPQPEFFPEKERIEAIAQLVGAEIAKRGKRLVSGFGLTVGGATLAGTLGVALSDDTPNLDKSVLLRPFPQQPPAGMKKCEFFTQYRDGMLRQAAISIFIAGMKQLSGKLETADGVLAEFAAARDIGHAIIPIGATGGAAAEIWREVSANFPDFWPGEVKGAFDRLSDAAAAPSDLVEAAFEMVDYLESSTHQLRKAK